MTAHDRIAAYFDRWNAQDGGGVAALFAPGGVYDDPSTGIAVRPFDLPTVVPAAARGFSDWKLEPGPPIGDDDRVAVEWTMRGVNTAAWVNTAGPTGKPLHLSGVDVFTLSDAGFTRVTRHFDRRTQAEQLGLQVLVEPHAQGPAVFGYSMRASSGNPHPPGVIALTWIMGRDQSEQDRIRGHSRTIVQDFLAEPGFIGIVTGFAGDRGFTVTAWETEDALYRALGKQHALAKHDFRTSDLSPGVWTSVWKPERLNRVWTRCRACGLPNDVNDDHRECVKCGAELPPRPTFW